MINEINSMIINAKSINAGIRTIYQFQNITLATFKTKKTICVIHDKMKEIVQEKKMILFAVFIPEQSKNFFIHSSPLILSLHLPRP